MLGQKRGPDAVIVGVLCAALFFGLIGLAVHFPRIVAIIVMALGLGYTVADSRRTASTWRTNEPRSSRTPPQNGAGRSL